MATTSSVLFDHPNPRCNAFLMMPLGDSQRNRELSFALRDTFGYYGITLLRADDKTYAPSIWDNVRAYMDACSLGVAVFDHSDRHSFNPNVSIELGYMLAAERPVLLLKDSERPSLPTDLVGHLYREYDSAEITRTVCNAARSWLRDVGVAKSSAERLVIYVSYGGTCRCAMAKVATHHALRGRQLPFRLRVDAVAHHLGPATEASRGARRAVYESFGKDLLADHRVLRRNPGLLHDADLVIVMDDAFRDGSPPSKTVSFADCFGTTGNPSNPWPDDEDDAARVRYSACMTQLRSAIEPNIERLLARLAGMVPAT